MPDEPSTDQPSPDRLPPESGKARANREFRIAIAVAIPLLAVGQILLFTGLRWVALFGIALPGTVVALLLVRRWQALERNDTT